MSISTAASISKDCEICISPSGTLLAIVTNTSSSNSEIKLYTLGSNHQSFTLSATRGFTGNSKSLEFTNNDVSLFYTSRAGTTTTLLKLPVATLATAASTIMFTQTSTTITGAIRKGVNGKIYYLHNISGSTTSTLKMFTNPDAATTNLSTNITTVIATGNMPVQPHLLAYSSPTTVVLASVRTLDRKEYELKDHLGNVHATVKDYKVPFSTGSPDLVMKEYFNGTTGGFTAVASPSGTTVDNNSNRMRVTGLSVGAAAQRTISLPAGAGQYLLSFDYDAGTCSGAQFDITNLTPSDGFTKGGMQTSGSYNQIIRVPTGMSSLDLRFEYQDVSGGKSFYIDNLVIKKVNETTAVPLATVVSEDFSTASDWVATNTVIDYTTSAMKITRNTGSSGTTFSATKSLNLLQGQLYKVTFDVTSLAMSGASLNIAFENDDNSTLFLDYNSPLSNTSTGSYTFYVTPKTNRCNVLYNILNPSIVNFTCSVDNFKVEYVGISLQPLYVSAINAMYDYYAFGSPMPKRQYTGVDYRYGFNGQEKDDEITGSGNINTAEFWEYDTRLGRRWNTDPEPMAFISEYSAFVDNPILFNDPEGNTVDPTRLTDKDKDLLKSDIESKTGYTIKETTNQFGDKRWEIDKSKGINKKGTSRLARREFRRAVKSGDNIILVSSDRTPYAQTGVKGTDEFDNWIYFNTEAIAGVMKGTSEGLNPTTMGYAMHFFHELRHTKAFAVYNNGEIMSDGHEDDEEWKAFKSPVDVYTNRIRRQLGSNYGKRQFYTGRIIVTMRDILDGTLYAYVAMDKKAARDIKKNKFRAPGGEFIKYEIKK
jgi:hypothetical protein